MARPYVVVSGLDGRPVVLTRERCEAIDLRGEQCRELVLARGLDGAALCWTHRKAAELRGVLPLEVVS
jgi:hypothetical protein